MTFDEEPRDVATDINLTAYTPKLFTSSAVASSKVRTGSVLTGPENPFHGGLTISEVSS